jgi:xylulokinase
MDTIISIDLGTTGLKVALVDLSGRLLAAAGTEYPIVSAQPGHAEQDPELWWQALLSGCARLRHDNPDVFAAAVGVGISDAHPGVP